jgi:hypothetical protein
MLQQDWPHLRAVLAKFRDGFYRSPDDLLSARYISN